MNKAQLREKQEAAKRVRAKQYPRRVQILYNDAIDKISSAADGVKFIDGTFDLAKYPALNRVVEEVLRDLAAKQTTMVVSGINIEWNQSQIDNDNLFRLEYNKLPGESPLLEIRNNEALAAFKQRKIRGLGLSERIWKNTSVYKREIEAGLAEGIYNGRPSKDIARELKSSLLEPDNLFRRVRENVDKFDKDGKLLKRGLKLSKAAAEYHPGQGIYRSSYKNSLRMVVTQTNMAYRQADMERYKASPFIIGYEVKLSPQHPRFDICDHLKGMYPVNFTFIGWHPLCICFSIAVMLSPDEYDEMERDKFNGVDITKKVYSKNAVKGTPPQLSKWSEDQKDRIDKWKSKPYFILDNPAFFKK